MDSDYNVRLATLEAMGGDTTKHYDSVYEIDLAILKIIEQGGGSGDVIKAYVDQQDEAVKEWVNTYYAKVVILTQAEYDALTTKDQKTIYIISDAA